MLRLVRYIKRFYYLKFFQRCMYCGGKVREEYFDMQYDFMVYWCVRCGKLLY